MTVTVANTANNNTFDYWRNRTNELAYAMSTKAVTTDSNTATGNAAITGSFTAQSFVISNTAGTFTISPGTVSTDILISGAGIATTIDSFTLADYKAAEYILSVKDNTANNFYASKMLVTHDGAASYISEYAIMVTNTNVGTFTSTSNTTHAILQFTGVSANNTVKFSRVII